MGRDDADRGVLGREFLERIIESVNPVAVVSRYTRLKKTGSNYKGLCPFHKEKTPSFTLDPERGLFYCFGCGKGGDIFTFVMEKEGLSFTEAVESLAREAGLKVPKRRKVPSEVIAMQEALEEAYKFYRKALFTDEGREGIEYLFSRGLNRNFIKEFGFGWAPNKWDALAKHIARKKLDPTPFVKVGLLVENTAKGGTVYDRFRYGIVIPISRPGGGGKLVAFALRSLSDGDGPKYINSPESAIYRKSDVLFGLTRARKEIISRGCAILVEGYFDVISLWLSGIGNVVASCGTALTTRHAAILSRFCDTVIIFYDGDDAGLKATYRAMEPLLRQELRVKIARPPRGSDPDDVARKLSPEKMAELLNSAPDWFDFSVAIAQQSGLWESVERKIRFVDKIAPYITALGNGLLASLYRKKLGEILGVGERELAARISRATRRAGITAANDEHNRHRRVDRLPADARAEIDLLAAAIANPTLCEEIAKSDSIVLYGGAFKRICDEVERTGECSVAALADIMEERAMSLLTQNLITFRETPTRADVEEIISCIQRQRLNIKRETLRISLKNAEKNGDTQKILSILSEISEIGRKIDELSAPPHRDWRET